MSFYKIAWCVLFFFVFACDGKTENQTDPSVQPQVTRSEWDFLSQLKPLSGDFNGDGKQDKLYVLSLTPQSLNAASSAKRYSSWPYYGDGKAPELGQGGPKAIVIAGGKGEYSVLFDPNKMSILDTAAAEELFVVSSTDKTHAVWADVGTAAKGDVIVVPTEAGIDSYLIWDGHKYTAFDLIEVP